MYKSIVPFIAAFLFAVPVFADENPFFNDNRNQIMFNLGQGVNSFGLISMPDNPVPFNMIQIQYSQPTEFFRMPARKSLNFIQTIGYGKNINIQIIQKRLNGIGQIIQFKLLFCPKI